MDAQLVSAADSRFKLNLKNQRVDRVISMAKTVSENRAMQIPTRQLNNLIADAMMMNQPPANKKRRLKIVAAAGKLTIGAFVEHILRHHLESYRDEIDALFEQQFRKRFER